MTDRVEIAIRVVLYATTIAASVAIYLLYGPTAWVLSVVAILCMAAHTQLQAMHDHHGHEPRSDSA